MTKVSGKIVLEPTACVEYFDLNNKVWCKLDKPNSYFGNIKIQDQSKINIDPRDLETIASSFLQSNSINFKCSDDILKNELIKFLQPVQNFIKDLRTEENTKEPQKSSNPKVPNALNIKRATYDLLSSDARNEIYQDDNGIIFAKERGSKEPYQAFRIIDDGSTNPPKVDNKVDTFKVIALLKNKIQKINNNEIHPNDARTIKEFIQSPLFSDFIRDYWGSKLTPKNTQDTPQLIEEEIVFFRYILLVYLGISSCFYDYNFGKKCSNAINKDTETDIFNSLKEYFGYSLECKSIPGKNINFYVNPNKPISSEFDDRLLSKSLVKNLSLEQIQTLDFDKIKQKITEFCKNKIILEFYLEEIIKTSIKKINILEFSCHFGTFLRLVNDDSVAYYAVIPHDVTHTQTNIKGNLYPLTRKIVDSLDIHDINQNVRDVNMPISKFLSGRSESQVATYFTNAIKNAMFCTATGQLYEPSAVPPIYLGW